MMQNKITLIILIVTTLKSICGIPMYYFSTQAPPIFINPFIFPSYDKSTLSTELLKNLENSQSNSNPVRSLESSFSPLNALIAADNPSLNIPPVPSTTFNQSPNLSNESGQSLEFSTQPITTSKVNSIQPNNNSFGMQFISTSTIPDSIQPASSVTDKSSADLDQPTNINSNQNIAASLVSSPDQIQNSIPPSDVAFPLTSVSTESTALTKNVPAVLPSPLLDLASVPPSSLLPSSAENSTLLPIQPINLSPKFDLEVELQKFLLNFLNNASQIQEFFQNNLNPCSKTLPNTSSTLLNLLSIPSQPPVPDLIQTPSSVINQFLNSPETINKLNSLLDQLKANLNSNPLWIIGNQLKELTTVLHKALINYLSTLPQLNN